MRNERLEAFETTLLTVLHEIDHALEARYGNAVTRHPARPSHGVTANPQYDGLFAVIANFTAGIGSSYGPGYTLDLRIATLNAVDPALREACETFMVDTLRKRLPEVFPDRELKIERDQHGWKLFGDLSLN
jgi:hypothetical protein